MPVFASWYRLGPPALPIDPKQSDDPRVPNHVPLKHQPTDLRREDDDFVAPLDDGPEVMGAAAANALGHAIVTASAGEPAASVGGSR
jgi:hypothetical protein